MTEFGAAASSSSSSSSSLTYQWPYHVFLSFRGEDTRYGFTGNLYRALRERGIRTFIDDEGIRKGEEITPTLLKTIKESKTAIVVFSKDYASSTFCLKELAQILDCMKEPNDRFIWPVFYDVDPSDIRHQKGSYKEAFDQYEGVKDETMVKRWRSALTEAADMSGWHFAPRSGSYEYKIIDAIVQVVSGVIRIGLIHVAQFPVGLESRVEAVWSLLNKEPHCDGATIVGIFGVGGIGKTTIARATYNEIENNFKHKCFLNDIKDYSICEVQKSLLSEILNEKDIKLRDYKVGISVITDRLRDKKILLVLDDISTLEQLRALAGVSNWFGSGSKIIITTRDKSLLQNHDVKRIYEVPELSDREARRLLILNAFKKEEEDPEYKEVINRAVKYGFGLPLALETFGSTFGRHKTVKEMESFLDIQEKFSNKTILQILKVSYDSLEELYKEVFLDIACFYRGYSLRSATKILSARYDIDSEYCINILIDKSLVKLGERGYFHESHEERWYINMHDLIQDMGREIVRQESPDVGQRSRLWSKEDILHVLNENTGTGTTQAMKLWINFDDEKVEWSGEGFEKMKNLRVLSFSGGKMFSQGPKCLPNSLRVMEWYNYPSSTLPDNFCPINLVILRLRNSHLKALGKACKNFFKLRELDLSGSQNLKELSDLSKAVNLKVLNVSYCEKLIKIDDSVGHLAKLEVLNAEGCGRLDTFIVGGIKLVSLEILNLSNCSNVHTFPEILVTMKKIKRLNLSHTAIKILPESIEKLVAIKRFWLRDSKFSQVKGSDLGELILDGLEQLPEIRKIPPNIEVFSGNSKLLTSSSIKALFEQHFNSLRKLDLQRCENLKELPDISGVVNLEELDVSNCKKLTKIDDSVGHLSKLRLLVAQSCKMLDTFIVRGIELVSIEIINLKKCSNLHIFSEILAPTEKIKTLDLSHTAIKSLPKSIENFISLEALYLRCCVELRQLPNLACLHNLKTLDLGFCGKLRQLPNLACLHNLKTLDLDVCSELEEITEIPPNIEVFSAMCCTSRLLSTQNFSSLRTLNLMDSGNLKEVPRISGAVNLEELNVSQCRNLTKIGDSVGHLDKLKVLNASKCDILDTFIVGGIKLISLEILDVSECSNLHTFPEILVRMEKIKTVDLSQTAVKILPESIEKLVALERISLSKSSNSKDFCRFNLKTLYLSGCRQLQEIRKLPPDIEVFFAGNCEFLTSSFIRALGKQNFYNLCQLNLHGNKNLEELPDISGAVNLEALDVSCCDKLTKIDDSVGRLVKLRVLNAERCINLDTFIVKGIKLVSLEVLNLRYCYKFHTFPEILVPMKKIKIVDMSHTALKILPESIEKLVALERLNNNYDVLDLPNLKTLYLVGCVQLQEIRKVPPNIKVISVKNFDSLTSSSIRALWQQNFFNLIKLNLRGSENLEELPDISGAMNLEELDISYCKKLTKIDDSVGLLKKLRVLNAIKCKKLDTFIVGGIRIVSIEILNLEKCSNLHTFPEILENMRGIKTLNLSCTAIKTLPESIEKLTSLEALYLNGCKELEEIKGIPPNIEVFFSQNCTSLTFPPTRLLLTEELQESRKTEFIMPGNEIPKWLHKHSTGGSVSFWVRRNLPQIALCAVVTGGPTIFSSFGMHINGVTEYCVRSEIIEIEIDHIFLFDLRHFGKRVARLIEFDLWNQGGDFRIDVESELLGKDWNHVKFSLEGVGTESRLKYIGVYVYNYDSCKEDILFENPIPQERIQVEAVQKIGHSNLVSSSGDNNEEEIVSDVEKKKGQLKVDNVNLTSSLTLPEPSSDTTSHNDLQQQQQLTSINQQTSESFEIVGKAKGNGIIVHGGDANEEKDKNAFQVTCQNALRSSNNESLTLDPMIGQYGLTRPKDQSTIIDEGHDGCHPMEWECRFTHPKDQSTIIDRGHDRCDPMEWEYQLTHPKDRSTIIDDKSKNQIMGPSTEVVSSARKKEITLKVDAVDGPSFSTTSEIMRDILLSDLQEQQHLSNINHQVSKSSENFKIAKGKNIIVCGDNANEEKDSNILEKDQSSINDKGHDETESHKARVTCFDLFSYLVSFCSSSAAS